MRLDHLLSKEEEVGVALLFSCEGGKCRRLQELLEQERLLVAMRPGETPVPIPNTMVKTGPADGTILETVWKSRWLPESL